MKHIKIYEQFDESDPFGEETSGKKDLKIVRTNYGNILIKIEPGDRIESGKECVVLVYDESGENYEKQNIYVVSDGPNLLYFEPVLYFGNKQDRRRAISVEYRQLPYHITKRLIN